MKVIFLDIDGVLVTQKELMSAHAMYPEFSRQGLLNLKRLVEETGAKIVLSSTWRLISERRYQAEWQLATVGLKFIDWTGRSPDGVRGKEIATWIAQWNHHRFDDKVTGFAILDDDSDMGDLLPHLVKTSMLTGLLAQHCVKAKEILEST
jgi:hypothetical protein